MYPASYWFTVTTLVAGPESNQLTMAPAFKACVWTGCSGTAPPTGTPHSAPTPRCTNSFNWPTAVDPSPLELAQANESPLSLAAWLSPKR